MKTMKFNLMKTFSFSSLWFTATLFLLTGAQVNAQTSIWTEPFNNTSGFSASDGTGYEDSDEYFRIKTSSTSNWDYNGNVGSFFAGRNIDEWHNNNDRAYLTWSNINIANYQSLQFSGNFASMEDEIDNSDRIDIEYRIDGGSWNTLLEFREDNDELEETTTNTDLSQTFTTINAAIAGTGSSLDLRIEIRKFDKDDEDFAFDEFEITGVVPVLPNWAFFTEPFDNDSLLTLTQGNFGTDGNTEYFMRTNSVPGNPYSGVDGYVLAGRDIDSYPNDGNNTKVLEWQNIPVANMSNLMLAIDAASTCDECETNDRIKITYKFNNSGWNNLLWFAGDDDSGSNNDEIAVDNDFNGTGEGTELTSSFQTFTRPISGSGNTITIRVTIEQFRANGEDFALDNLKLYGDAQNNQIIYANGSWSPLKPNKNSGAVDVLVQNGSVTLNKEAECANLTVNSGATLTIKKNKAFTVNGDITNNGTINVEDRAILNQTTLTDNNSGNGTYNVSRETPMLANNTRYNFWASPIVGEVTGDVFVGSNLNYIFSNDGTGWNPEGGNAVMVPGRGYTALGDWTATYPSKFTRTFSGNQVNNGDITVSNLYDSTSSILIGNPYPSPIDAQAFANDNPNVMAFYFWDHKTQQGSSNSPNDWATYLPSQQMGTKVCATCLQPNGTIGVAQGFRVLTNTTVSNVTFKNSQRVAKDNHMFHAPSDVVKFWINLESSNGDFDQSAFALSESATTGIDNGFEALKKSSNPNLSFYSIVDGEELAIQSTNKPSHANKTIIPLGVDAGLSGDYTFSVDSIYNWKDDYKLFLVDEATGTRKEIKTGVNYTFTVATSASFTNRFYLEVEQVYLENDDAAGLNAGIGAEPEYTQEEERVSDETEVEAEILWNGVEAQVILNDKEAEIRNWMVFNVSGQLVETLNSSNNTQSIYTKNSGIYLIKVNYTDGTSTTRKVFIR